ncbi:MAG TPA: PIN domain-containing protein [Fimbriimonas sp.]|nr:PIN domain-containing protein [Fimbriimonas sp.]
MATSLSQERKYTIAKAFFDTNILIYAADSEFSEKREAARQVLNSHRRAGSGAISTQVMLEFQVNAIRKLGLSSEHAHHLLTALRAGLEVVSATPDLVDEAIALSQRYQLGPFDAMILASAQASRCSVLLTEDFSSGARLGSVRVENPLPK